MMRKQKTSNIKILVILLILLYYISSTSAASSNFCDSILNQQSIGGTQSIFNIAFLIMLAMIFVIAIAYLLGYSFKIDRLIKFAKSEFGEIIVTGILLIIFGGFIFAVNGMGSSQSSTSQINSVYYVDCNNFYFGASVSITEIRGLLVDQFILPFIDGFYIKISKITIPFSLSNSGISFAFSAAPDRFQPLGGLSPIYSIFMNTIMTMGVSVTGILLVVAFMLGIFYAMLPFFFYLGIIFRTFPWTRAMGGSFLALFIAFYIVFPLLIFAMIIAPSNEMIAGNKRGLYTINNLLSSSSNTASNLMTVISTYLQDLASGWNMGGMFNDFSIFIHDIIAPSIYNLLAVIISLIISYDLLEGLGDLLGSPSLSSKHALKKVI